MKFIGILLNEGRKEDLKKKYFDKYDEEELDFILGISDLQDFNHKYTDWVLKHILAYDDVDMMVEVAVELVKDFDKYQKQLEKKDINQYRSFEELDSALAPLKVKEQERLLESQTERIYEDDDFLVLVPKTQEASCKYGSGTKWCVPQRGAGHFERDTQGNQGLYFILRKKGKQTEPHYKVAVHIDNTGNQTWWDSRDARMNNESVTLFKDYFPYLYQIINMDFNQVLFKDKTFSNLLEDIYKNANRKEKEIKALIDQLKPMIQEPGDAMMLVPLLKEYMELGIKNDEALIKMAGIVQRAMSNTGDGGDGGILSDRDKELLFQEINNVSIKQIENK